MNEALPHLVAVVAVLLILGRLAAELGLSWLNRCHVLRHAGPVPASFQGIMDNATYSRSIDYTLAKGRLGRVEDVWRAAVLLAILFSGVLPMGFEWIEHSLGQSAWAMAVGVLSAALVLWLAGLPFEWYSDFKLEKRFGFSKTTPGLWILDRVKALTLSALLGYPLVVLMLKFVDWTGSWWWLWAWGALTIFQLTLSVLAPVLILPLFNRFTPLPAGPLRDRLMALAEKTRFRAQSIQVMDGSRRSAHSNAFFTGFSRFRRIVLFDTLIDQLAEEELEAVLAHEVGHYKLKHIVRMLLISTGTSFLGFWLVSLLARSKWFYEAFGFDMGSIAPALLIFGLLAGTVSFWVSPLLNALSRSHEYAADAYAARVTGQPDFLVAALQKLATRNLSNLTPHPLYSAFYYSHPTLTEREQALATASICG